MQSESGLRMIIERMWIVKCVCESTKGYSSFGLNEPGLADFNNLRNRNTGTIAQEALINITGNSL